MPIHFSLLHLQEQLVSSFTPMAKGKKQNGSRDRPAPQPAGSKRWDEGNGTSSSLPWISKPLALVCAVASILLYWNTYSNGWAYDDYAAILYNGDAKCTTPLGDLLRNDFWGQTLVDVGSNKSFRPLTVLTFRINYILSGLNASSFHFWNIVLNALAVYASVWTASAVLGARPSLDNQITNYALLVACVLYTFHPIHTETVANTVGRAELLGAILEFAAFWCHYRSMDQEEDQKKGKLSSAQYLLASMVLGFVSALAKEPCLMVLAICGANEIATIWLPMTMSLKTASSSSSYKRLGQSMVRFALLASTGVVYMFMRLIINGDSVGIKPQFKDNPLLFTSSKSEFVLTALHIQAVYIWKLIYPFHFCCDYGFKTRSQLYKSWETFATWQRLHGQLGFVFWSNRVSAMPERNATPVS